MAVILDGGCRVSQMREGEPAEVGNLRLWSQVDREQGAVAISLRVLEVAPGVSPGLRNPDCDEILFLLDGEPSTDLFIDGRLHRVEAGCGIYLRPNQVWTVRNNGTQPIVLISSRCPEPKSEESFGPPLTATSVGATESSAAPIVRLADRAPQQTADRWYRVLVDDEVGSTQATQFVGSIPPGRAPDHFHNYEEVLFILKGAGRMWAGETNTPIAEGSCIYLPKGQVHCVENTGAGELRLLGVFYPAGSPSVRYDV
jgi:mannose-6-phosphate isomerase-like protein (cupin superfamily)